MGHAHHPSAMSEVPDTVLITGCSSGIGRATAERFHDRGWDVYATARTPSDIDDLADKGMQTLELDVTEDGDCERAVDEVVEDGGGIGCLVNNAGYGEMAAVEDLSVEDLEAQLDVNTYGPHRLTRLALPQMREQDEDGTIVNLSSVSGRVSTPGMGAYCASKFALEAMSDALRAEVRNFGVDVVLVEPGPVETPFGDKAEAVMDGHADEDGPYRELYDRIGEYNEGLSGDEAPGFLANLTGRIAVPPERVARTVVHAAEARSPKARYRVSLPHRVMAMGRYVPGRLQDWAYDRMI
jgi:NAD(P)-dependent dehydrogenase (short-subunit alcohol dehydrogenase family)